MECMVSYLLRQIGYDPETFFEWDSIMFDPDKESLPIYNYSEDESITREMFVGSLEKRLEGLFFFPGELSMYLLFDDGDGALYSVLASDPDTEPMLPLTGKMCGGIPMRIEPGLHTIIAFDRYGYAGAIRLEEG